MSGKAPADYSTNPHTIRTRNRKMSMTGAQKVEDSARTADYKALLYARKTLEAKPEYLAASGAMRNSMLDQTLRETMERRRARGQDTLSKLAAFHANDSRALRAGTGGPQPQAPIPQFLEENGFVPARAGRQPSGPVSHHTLNDHVAGASPAPYPDGGGSSTPSLNGVQGFGNSEGNENARFKSTLFVNGALPTGHVIKASHTPVPFANMTSEPMQSIEVDPADDVLSLRSEVASLHSTFKDVLSAYTNLRDIELENLRAELGAEMNNVAKLEGRLCHLENGLRAVNNVSVLDLGDRLAVLEGVTKELKVKVGDGCEAEVAKMREVFASFREALVGVGNCL